MPSLRRAPKHVGRGDQDMTSDHALQASPLKDALGEVLVEKPWFFLTTVVK